MNKVSHFFLFIFMLSSIEVNAIQDNNAIEDDVKHFLMTKMLSEGFLGKINIKVQNIDDRLQLPRCDAPLDMQYNNNQRSRLQTVKVSCETPRRWSLYVSAEVSRFLPIAVSLKPLNRGELITPNDVELREMEINPNDSSILTDLSGIIGQEVRRSIALGEPIRSNQIIAPQVINRGDRVTLVARSGNFSVRTTAIALDNGRTGETIRIENVETEKRLRAEVVDEATVAISI